MHEDDVLRTVTAAREEYCRQFAHDLTPIVRALHERDVAERRQVVSLPPRRPTHVPAKTPA